jgi:hypothetical protein
MRRTSKNEAAARARYARTCRSNSRQLRVLSPMLDKQNHSRNRGSRWTWDCERSEREFKPCEYGTHLTVKWGVDVKKNEVIDRGRKSCHTRKGVDLQKEQISSSTAQKPGLSPQTQIVHR